MIGDADDVVLLDIETVVESVDMLLLLNVTA
jgi:hypothetical protein